MRQAKILIVDDSDLDRKVLRRAFGKFTTEPPLVDEAESAVEAISTFSRNDYDAVILDINMPGHDGFHALREMRAEKGKSWPLIFMYSSSTHPKDVQEAYRNRATAYISKPLKLADIQLVANNCMNLVRETVALM